MSLKIAQLSDLHLGASSELTFGVSSRTQFISTLKMAVDHAPDLIWISGDLCLDEPNPRIYPWIKGHLDQTGIPYRVIAGNHDNSLMLSQSFHQNQLKNRELYFSERLDGHHIVYLDSAKGKFSRQQWEWLREEMHESVENPHIVMHHPPVYAGVVYMDNRYPFIDQEEFLELAASIDRPIHIYCGHYHLARYIQHKNINIHICPSTLFQIDSNLDEFKLESTTPGMSLITLNEDRVEVQVFWNIEST